MKKQSIIVAVAAFALLSFSSCMKKPMACVDSATKTATVGQSVSFDASCTMDAHHYEWDFGDGATGSGATTTHAYNSKGTFTAKIKAMSKNMKKEDEKAVTVTVN
jgi:PKD repeat protein